MRTLQSSINRMLCQIRPVALATIVCCASASHAQDVSTYYTVQHPEQFKIDWGAFYRDADARTAAVRARVPHFLDLPFGADAKQKLDVYLPEKKPKHAPVFIFLHGGGFREGDRAQYGYVAGPFVARGVITVVASYRLTGNGHRYPDQTEDAKLALKWTYLNIAKYGGDPRRLFIGGHSAGAILAADVGVNRGWMKTLGIPETALRGIAPISGDYDLRSGGRHGELDVYAPSAEAQERASPLLHVSDPAPWAVIALGAQETSGNMMNSSQQLAQKLQQSGSHVTFLSLEGKDHRGAVQALGDGSSELFQDVMQMIQGKSGNKSARR